MPSARASVIAAGVLGAALVFWPAVASPQSDCRAGALPPCGAPDPAPVAAPTVDELASGEFRLFSPVFAALPATGYPIAFRRDGATVTANLAGVTGWSVPAAGHLELSGGGRLLYAFLWSERHGAFRHVIAGGAGAGLSMVIAPAALDRLRVAAAMEERPRVEVDPTLLPSLLVEPPPPVVLTGAKVGDEDEAVRVAISAYFARAGGMRALQSVRAVGAASLGFDMPGFATAGDRVWELRVYERGTLSAVIWVNAETGRPRFLAP